MELGTKERQVVTQRDVDEASFMNLDSARHLVRKTECIIEHLTGDTKVQAAYDDIEVRGVLPRLKAEQDQIAASIKVLHSNVDRLAHLVNYQEGPPEVADHPEAAIRRGPAGRR
jgi:small-conductance mechanosensitive channel